ncbi:MAG: type IV toxin-antitoxin system AbiEi family antitoxin domain-containing protein [Acidimicrobiales bacterium]
MRHERVAALLALAAKQGAFFTTAQASAIGLTSDALWKLVRSGLFVRERQGLYRLASVSRNHTDRAIVAVLTTGGVLSYRSAAHRHEILRRAPITEVTVSFTQRPRGNDAFLVHRARQLSESEWGEVRGVPTTSPERTLLDLSRPAYRMHDSELKKVVSAALAKRLVTPASLQASLRSTDPRTPGLRRLTSWFARLSDADGDSPYERLIFDMIRDAGLPLPRTEFVICDEHGDFVAKVDQAWPAERVVHEIDGWSIHSDPITFENDRVRGNEIVRLGWTLLRSTPSRIDKRPDEVIRSIRAALEHGHRASGRMAAPNSWTTAQP